MIRSWFTGPYNGEKKGESISKASHAARNFNNRVSKLITIDAGTFARMFLLVPYLFVVIILT